MADPAVSFSLVSEFPKDLYNVFGVLSQRGSFGTKTVAMKAKDKSTKPMFVAVKHFRSPRLKELSDVYIPKMAELKHHNLVRLVGSTFEAPAESEQAPVLVVAFELFRANLRAILQKQKLTDATRDGAIRNVFAQVLLGIQYLDSQKVVVVNLKPENILLDNACDLIDLTKAKVKISDFALKPGLALKSKGLENYLAPEIVADLKAPKEASAQTERRPVPISSITDIYACGVIAYEIKLGRVPQERDVFTMIANEDLRDFIRSMMARNPKERLLASSLINHKFLVGK
eukprot:maker-scaffold861_size87375-snap-gene-0.20 protein:Tk02185 transcript:maker-scaffold861_size87375-snap-gene-0.20-mRNA-1 annotation:"phota4 phototropin blue light photoreceptor"